MIRFRCICLGLLSLSFQSSAQAVDSLVNQLTKNPMDNLKKLVPKPSIGLSGMITGNHLYYHASGIPDRNVPLNILYTGNLTADLFGKIKMPISFSFSNQALNNSGVNVGNPLAQFGANPFRQPFNRLQLRPTYKGFTAQLGTCALQFSPYTLAGRRYDGIGLTYKSASSPFFAGFMLGNLQRAIQVDTTGTVRNNYPSYKQQGLGLQLGYRKQDDAIELIYFTASDRISSLPYSLDEYNILPQQNAVVSLKGSKTVYKQFLVSTELAVSGITNDSRATPEGTTRNLFTTFLGTFTPRASTDYRKAFRLEVQYRTKTLQTGLLYSRVDPNYRTLGAYYFVNDLETVEGKLATQFLQGRLTLSGQAGFQQDNVLKQKLKTNRRLVGSLNLTYLPTDKLNLLVSYSNFSSYSNLRSTYDYLRQVTPYNALDTLNFRQINQNLMVMGTLTLPNASTDINQSITLNGLVQRGDDSQGGQQQSSNLTNLSLDYTYQHNRRKLLLTTGFNFSHSNFSNLPSSQWGPSLSLNKTLSTHWKTSLSGLYTWGRTASSASTSTQESLDTQEQSLNARGSLSGQLLPQLSLTASLIYLSRQATSTDRYLPNFSELTATLGLSYQFSLRTH
ncbi:TonB-dependent receptor [Spirosoma litoris]